MWNPDMTNGTGIGLPRNGQGRCQKGQLIGSPLPVSLIGRVWGRFKPWSTPVLGFPLWCLLARPIDWNSGDRWSDPPGTHPWPIFDTEVGQDLQQM